MGKLLCYQFKEGLSVLLNDLPLLFQGHQPLSSSDGLPDQDLEERRRVKPWVTRNPGDESRLYQPPSLAYEETPPTRSGGGCLQLFSGTWWEEIQDSWVLSMVSLGYKLEL